MNKSLPFSSRFKQGCLLLFCSFFIVMSLSAQFTGGSGSGYATTQPSPSLLPVIWGEMNGVCSGNSGALIQWTTLQEYNTSHFDVYRSYDGDYYDWVGRVNASQNAYQTSYYQFEDPFAFSNPHKWAFYALLQYDQDESMSRLQTPILVQNHCGLHNQANNHPVFVSSSGMQNSFVVFCKNKEVVYDYSLINASGSIISKGGVQDTHTFYGLTPGVYFLRVSHFDFQETLKVLVF